MKILRVWLILLLFTPLLGSAQAASEYEEWKKQYMGEFKQYKDEIDREFASFLKQRWKPFDTKKGFVRDVKPKPVIIPVAIPEPEPPVIKVPEPQVKIPEPEPVVLPEPPVKKQPKIVLPVIIPPTPGQNVVKIDFLGFEFDIPDSFSSELSVSTGKISQQSIQTQFADLAQSDYPETVQALKKIKQQMNLNDWAFISLVNRFTGSLSIPQNSQTITSWFLLLKSGLDTRIAFSADKIFLLVATQQNLYDIAFFKFDNQKYYAVSKQNKLPRKLFSYDGKYPKQLNLSNFSPESEINSRPDKQIRRLKFDYQGREYKLDIPYNKYTVEFLASYPQMDINQYFRSPLSDSTASALTTQLRPMLAGMSETEAVNFLLGFVQKAFDYKTDGDQFGAENYMFIEETLFYPSSDCEDRSIIFSWLVQNLLGLEVIALDFPGHIATAVALKQPAGDVVNYRQKLYTVADPTYVNARAGMKMPQYKNVSPKVISII